MGLMVGFTCGADPRHCAGWWRFHAGVGCVLMVWVGSTDPLNHITDRCRFVSVLGDCLQPFMDFLSPHGDGITLRAIGRKLSGTERSGEF